MNRAALSLLDEGTHRAGNQAPSWENRDAGGGGPIQSDPVAHLSVGELLADPV